MMIDNPYAHRFKTDIGEVIRDCFWHPQMPCRMAALVKVFGCRLVRSSVEVWTGVRKPPMHEPAAMRKTSMGI